MISLLDRYRDRIESGLRGALRGETSLLRILRYHVGLGDGGASLGKLIRPSLVLFTAEELGGRVDDALPAAVGLELVHGFSLIHDDLQDRDETRRGRPSVWVRWGSAEAINAGDLMHAIALQTALSAGPAAAERLVAATCEMIEGQSMDLAFERRFVTEEEYLAMVDRKTGALFRCAFELGGLCARADAGAIEVFSAIGADVARAFQIRDDALGIWGDGEAIGKPVGSDVRRKKKSYPVVAGHAEASSEDRRRLEGIYAEEAVVEEDVAWVVALLDRLGARARAEAAVEARSGRALGAVERAPFTPEGRRALCELIEGLTRRDR